MSLIVEDGTGRSDSESYCSVDFADTYHVARGNFNWPVDASSVADKEAALRRASDYMLQMYRVRWLGSRVQLTQALDWPRYGVVLNDTGFLGYYIDLAGNVPVNIVPTAVQQACAQLALKAIAIDDSGNAFDLAPDLQRQTRREKVGSLEVEYEPGGLQYVRYRAIDKLLEIFLNGGLTGISLVRG